MIHNIYSGGAKQKPPEDVTPPLQLPPPPTPETSILFSSGDHLLSDLHKTFHGSLGHRLLLSWKRVASEIHLPAINALPHPILQRRSAALRCGLHELGVGFRPLVEVNVGCPDRNSRLVIHAVWYACFAHFTVVFGWVIVCKSCMRFKIPRLLGKRVKRRRRRRVEMWKWWKWGIPYIFISFRYNFNFQRFRCVLGISYYEFMTTLEKPITHYSTTLDYINSVVFFFFLFYNWK